MFSSYDTKHVLILPNIIFLDDSRNLGVKTSKNDHSTVKYVSCAQTYCSFIMLLFRGSKSTLHFFHEVFDTMHVLLLSSIFFWTTAEIWEEKEQKSMICQSNTCLVQNKYTMYFQRAKFGVAFFFIPISTACACYFCQTYFSWSAA